MVEALAVSNPRRSRDAHLLEKRIGERTLANAGLSGHEHQPSPAGARLVEGAGKGGQLDGASSYLMKSPHNQRPDPDAREMTEEFIAKHATQRGLPSGGKKKQGKKSKKKAKAKSK